MPVVNNRFCSLAFVVERVLGDLEDCQACVLPERCASSRFSIHCQMELGSGIDVSYSRG